MEKSDTIITMTSKTVKTQSWGAAFARLPAEGGRTGSRAQNAIMRIADVHQIILTFF
jgi:hypothetical protein